MKIISVPIAVLVFVSASLVGWQIFTQRGSYVVGGEYILHSGEVLTGNLQTLFAQVTLENGARVDGRIVSLSSALDIAGAVRGDILAIGSELKVRDTAQLLQSPRQFETVHLVILLPKMARVKLAAQQ